jgi:hypothetical protein
MNHPSPEASDRRPEFVTLIAIYQFVTAGILLLLSCLVLAFMLPAIVVFAPVAEGAFLALILAASALALLLGFGFASIIVGWGLIRMREWARLGALVLALFALIGFPIWTIAGVLILIYLTTEDARAAFARRNQRNGASTGDDYFATQAAYKAGPPPPAPSTVVEQTRPMRAATSTSTVTEGPASPESFSDEQVTRRIEPATPTPGDDTEQPTVEIEPDTPHPEPAPPAPPRKWVVPAEEAGMDRRILEPLDSEQLEGEDENEGWEKSR